MNKSKSNLNHWVGNAICSWAKTNLPHFLPAAAAIFPNWDKRKPPPVSFTQCIFFTITLTRG